MSNSLSSRLSNASYESSYSYIPLKTRKERIIVLKTEQKSNKKNAGKNIKKKNQIRTVNLSRETRPTNLTPENLECKNLKQ